MPGRKSFQLRGGRTTYGLCLVVLCAGPFFFDAAICDEFNAAALYQSALADGEGSDPFKTAPGPFSPDSPIAPRISPPENPAHHKSVLTGVPLNPTRLWIVVSLTSRPPPLS